MRFRSLAAFAAFAAMLGPANAQNWAVGTQIGTTGVGAELQYRMAPGWILRGTADWLGYDHDESYQAVSYRGHLRFATAGAFIDWHPFQSWLLVSAGAYFGQRKIALSAQPSSNVVIDQVSFTPAQTGKLDGWVKMNPVQPFAGLGIDNTFLGRPGLGFKAMGGVAYGGSPKVKMESSGGTLTGNAIFQNHLANERDQIRKDAQNYKFFPVVYLGLTYGL